MKFRKRKTRVSLNKDLIIDNVKIDLVDKTRFLGVMIDPCLTFSSHISYIKGKIARGVGILNKCKRYLSESTLVTLYYSFVYPYYNYCNCIWGNTFKTYLDPLIKLQKRAVRTIASANRRAHTEDLFKRLKILPVDKLFIYCTQLFMFKFYHGLVPGIFQNFFASNESIHSHNTRQSSHLHSFGAHTSLRHRCVRMAGVNIFNHFYDILNLNCLFVTYKYHLKTYLSQNDVSILITG